LFCCIGGENQDGHDFAEQAIRDGATALLVDHVLSIDAPQVVVRDVRMSMGLMAAALRNFPSKRMHVVGVTGTNGKTTTAHVLAEILRTHGWKTEVIGTLTGT
jgi:UDP-N-acetylmuramoyl-L-alanyl-D-glutamate--2,6-diaminopimelate ligase